jgi:hypothetical protein
MPKVEHEFTSITDITVLSGEKASYQIAYVADKVRNGKIEIESDIKDHLHTYKIECVPVKRTVFFPKSLADDNYISIDPGLYPDLLQEFTDDVIPLRYYYQGIWIETDNDIKPGKHEIKITISEDTDSVTQCLSLEVLAQSLPEQDLLYSVFVHADCLADYYGYEVFSPEHWDILEKFIKLSAEYGSNALMPPIFTPPVDTQVGGERTTVQLVKIEKIGDSYTFDFSLFERYIKTCHKYGIKYFYIPSFFTQWGAEFTPKIIATENGESRRISGWDVKSTDEKYLAFLKQFIPCLVEKIKELNIQKNVLFSISDEPFDEVTVERYSKLSAFLKPMLEDFKIMDAFTHQENFEKSGAHIPLIPTSDIGNFDLNTMDNLSVYYCCAQDYKVSNRFITMPLFRNRSFAYQLYKYNVKAFFHWALNFYNAPLSVKRIDPFSVPDADGGYPAGDCFSVYPGENGPLKSMRIVVFNEVLQDLRAFKLLESYIGRDKVIEIIENITGEITFENCARNASTILALRNAVITEIKKHIS